MSFFGELYDGAGRSGDGQRMFSVTTGKVVKNWDDKHPGMVQVEIFLGEGGKNRTDWVRVARKIGRIPDGELEVMQAVWDCAPPVTRGDVEERLKDTHPRARSSPCSSARRRAS